MEPDRWRSTGMLRKNSSEGRSFHAVHAVQPDFFDEPFSDGVDVLLAADVHGIDADGDAAAACVHGLAETFIMGYDRTAVGQVYQFAPAIFIDDGKAATKVLDAAFKVADAWDIKSHMGRRPARQGRNVDGQAVDAGNESVHLVDDPVHTAPEGILDAPPRYWKPSR